MTDAVNDPDLMRAKLNQETSRIAWKELQRFFAAGRTLSVSAAVDLVEVAAQMSLDNKAQVEQWLAAGAIGPVTDVQAQAWYDADAVVWAVVVSPWVLIQFKA